MMSLDEWTTEFTKRLKWLMQERKLNNKELAKKTGVTNVTIGRYVNGKHIPDAYTIIELSKALGCSVSYLIDFGEMVDLKGVKE